MEFLYKTNISVDINDNLDVNDQQQIAKQIKNWIEEQLIQNYDSFFKEICSEINREIDGYFDMLYEEDTLLIEIKGSFIVKDYYSGLTLIENYPYIQYNKPGDVLRLCYSPEEIERKNRSIKNKLYKVTEEFDPVEFGIY